MRDERPLSEALARCVSILVCQHNGERTARSTAAAAEIAAVAGQICELGYSAAEVERVLTESLHGEMVARYGHEVGPRLAGEFTPAIGRCLAGRGDTRGR